MHDPNAIAGIILGILLATWSSFHKVNLALKPPRKR